MPKACTVEELLADPSIEVVLNLTIPLAHAEIMPRGARRGQARLHGEAARRLPEGRRSAS